MLSLSYSSYFKFFLCVLTTWNFVTRHFKKWINGLDEIKTKIKYPYRESCLTLYKWCTDSPAEIVRSHHSSSSVSCHVAPCSTANSR